MKQFSYNKPIFSYNLLAEQDIYLNKRNNTNGNIIFTVKKYGDANNKCDDDQNV